MASRRTTLPIIKDFVFKHGNDFVFEYIVKNPDHTAIDNTGWRIDMDIRQSYSSAVIRRFSSETSDFTLGGATGTITLRIPLAEINGYKLQSHVYDIRETYNDDTSKHRYRGVITVEEASTRDP